MQKTDNLYFTKENIPLLKEALSDLAFLMDRNYPLNASLKLIGDKFGFPERVRTALMRCVCTKEYLQKIQRTQINVAHLRNQEIIIDAFNLLIVLECAFIQQPIFKGLDTCIRDIASIHGTYKSIEETNFSIQLVGKILSDLQVKKVEWVLDSPISHSGSLKQKIISIAQENQWNWEVILHKNPDQHLIENSEKVVISSDSWILENAKKWCNLSAYLIENFIPNAWIVSFN
jgi:hypothetical protein